MPNPTEQIDAVKEARELLDAIDKSARIGYALKLLKTLADEVEILRGIRCRKCGGETYEVGFSQKVHKVNDSLLCPKVTNA